ncbi:MAG: GDP-mannose dehydrogenase, partial [Desulfomonilaceae bacterium]
MVQEYSLSPDGEKFALPTESDYLAELARLEQLVAENRAAGREIVVVMGLGFVGAVMAAVIADSVDESGNPGKYVIGMQRPSTRSFWKIPLICQGKTPMKAEDPEVSVIIHRTVIEKKTLTASFSYKALGLADVVVVDVQCDYVKNSLKDVSTGYVLMDDLEKSLEIIG